MVSKGEVWSAALVELCESGEFVVSDLGFDDDDRHVVRRALKEMNNNGWVTSDGMRSAIRKPGELAEKYLQLED